MFESLFFEIGAVIVVAAAFAFVARLLKQPLIVSYIVAGVLIGPSLLALTKSTDTFETMSQLGVAFLLFTVGLGLNWRRVKEVGLISVATGVGQVLFTAAVGWPIGLWLGFDAVTSAFIAVAFTFSSTIIIIKILSDKEDLDTLYGKISVGFLVVQDLIAMFLLLALSSLQGGGTLEGMFLSALVKGVVAIGIVFLLSTWVVPRLVAFAASSQELLLLFALGWCFLVAGLLSMFGFGIELGALLAGVSLSGTIYHHEINARIRPLRDFFLVIFFIVLGSQLDPSALPSILWPAAVFSLFILVGNPLILMIIMRSLGYHPHTSFKVSAITAQISEFSFILLGSAVALGYVAPSVITLTTAVGLVTIAASSYLVKYNEQIYDRLQPFFRWLEPDQRRHERAAKNRSAPEILMCGYHRMGRVLLKEVGHLSSRYLVVDFDPQVISNLLKLGVPAIYGDVSDHDLLTEIRAEKAKMILSTVPSATSSLDLLAYLRSKKYRGVAVVTVQREHEAQRCYEAGATYVIVPSVLGAVKFCELLHHKQAVSRNWKTLGLQDREAMAKRLVS